MNPETFKGGAHFAMGGFAGALLLYNVMRYAETRAWRNAMNVGAYTLLLVLEGQNTRHHWRKS